MSNRAFNPKYHFDDEGYSVVALTRVREDDFLRILNLCEQSFNEEVSPAVTGVNEHRRDQAETIHILRSGGYTVNDKGEITIVFEPYDDRKPNKNRPLSLQRVESVITSANLRFSAEVDPNHRILGRLQDLKSSKYAYRKYEDAPLSKDDQRLYYLFSTLKDRLDEPRQTRYMRWMGPSKGWFGRVVDMPAAEVKVRREKADDRKAFEDRMNEMFANIRAKKADAVAA